MSGDNMDEDDYPLFAELPPGYQYKNTVLDEQAPFGRSEFRLAELAMKRMKDQTNWPRKAQEMLRKDEIQRNKFYVGASSVFARNWGHKKIEDAVHHAKNLLESEDREEVIIVQIVRVVRKKKVVTPVEVEVVR